MAPDPGREHSSIFILFILPYILLSGYTLTLAGHGILIGNLYYLSSAASQYLGTLNHSLGCVSQLVNWVTILTYLIVISLFQGVGKRRSIFRSMGDPRRICQHGTTTLFV
ncbi:uncharacterized protein BJ212DRAFT_1335513 [Suillus subaureus]|uniref:Uncharacterized protein n=1 Tax=Suillus subaureus TaxID=48587 RepID=A0A9P7EIS7_9AGAM|nr:uncharacterized protein BJ212DRAFT_1335513 [Suillus subaureus]KAG1822047.1 hypothetical protein BJ212DRAFT_1335513 [Suillus subaureus]